MESEKEMIYLCHHGIKGQKWGYRRWQNSDGSLTPAGVEHYSKGVAGFRKASKERKMQRIDKRIARKEKYLNDPKHLARLAKANQKSAKFEQRKAEYIRKQDRADRAVIFQESKQRRADRAYKRMMRANKPSAQRVIAKHKAVEYQVARQKAIRNRVANKYVKRYGKASYNDIFG